MKIRKLPLLLALVLLLAAAVPANAAAPEASANATRGELITALHQLKGGADEEPYQTVFRDVPDAGKMARVLRWAADNGIVYGYGDGRFGPDDPVTREQAAAMLYRCTKAYGQDLHGAWTFPRDYPDAGEISAYADEAMHWAVMNGILAVAERGLEPRAYVTKTQLSLILQRWQKSMIASDADGACWYRFAGADAALRVPSDAEFLPTGRNSFAGGNDRISIVLALWDQISDPDIDALAALAAGSGAESPAIVDRNGLAAVKADPGDGTCAYYFLAPNGDAYFLSIGPNTDRHPELTTMDVAEELQAIDRSICRGTAVPAGERAVELPVPERPDMDYLVLVNKQNALPADWEDNLDTVFTVNSLGNPVEVERTAYKAYLALKADLAENDGIFVELDSARRSVAAQQDIMDRFTEKYGADYAAKTVAKPGYSEHHTGLALDLYFRLNGEDVYHNEDMMQYPEIWEKIHARLAGHGFILRYLEGKEHITGYGYEPWHLRYVGVETARAIMAEPGLTLEVWLGAAEDPELKIDYGNSTLYTAADLDEAMIQIKCRFAFWTGCELHSIRYAGDACSTEARLNWLNSLDEGKGYTQTAEFLSDFHTAPDVQGDWDPDREYTDLRWWLARTEDGGWQLITWGWDTGDADGD